MFGWASHLWGKVAIGISSILVGLAGFVSPPHNISSTTVATSTSAAKTEVTTTTSSYIPVAQRAKSGSSFVPIAPAPKSNPPFFTKIENQNSPTTDPSLANTSSQPVNPPQTKINCNGKIWLACATGTTFYCPATGGDATCVANTAQTQNTTSAQNSQAPATDPMIAALNEEFKKQQAKNDAILDRMLAVRAKYQPQEKLLYEQLHSLTQQTPITNQLLLDEGKIMSQITELDRQQEAELETIPGYSSIHVSPSATTIPLYDPSVSFITVMSPQGAKTLQITSYQSGTYFVADTSTGKSYMISGGSGVYSVSPF